MEPNWENRLLGYRDFYLNWNVYRYNLRNHIGKAVQISVFQPYQATKQNQLVQTNSGWNEGWVHCHR